MNVKAYVPPQTAHTRRHHFLVDVFVSIKVKKVIQSHYRPEVPRGFQEVNVPRLRDNGPGWW